MAREIPVIVRAAAGLAATVLDEARSLPETLPGLPIRLIGCAMQQVMKVQQQYAGLVARGDEVFTGLRGADEPGLATFDDDEPAPATVPGFRDSAFDRADGPASASTYPVTDAEDEQVADEAPAIAGILDEIAIDDLVDQAPMLDETAPTTPDADRGADVATTVDVLTPDGDDATVEAAVTDAGIAAAEGADGAGGATADDGATALDESGTPVAAATGAGADTGGARAPAVPAGPDAGGGAPASSASRRAPVDGYDGFSIAQLRGHLRGYALVTVEELLSYEEATRARAPYLKVLRNRLEKLAEQAVESSPLAPRGT